MNKTENKRVNVNLSMNVKTHESLKRMAIKNGKSVSGLVSTWTQEKEQFYQELPPIILSQDTFERLEQYAYENHTTPTQALTDMVWKAKVKNANIRGQMSF